MFPFLGEVPFLNLAFKEGFVQIAFHLREHLGDIVQVLLRAALAKILELPNNHVFGWCEPDLYPITSIFTSAILERPLMQRIFGCRIDIRFESALRMDQIEMSVKSPASN